jgi:hypothetical protein
MPILALHRRPLALLCLLFLVLNGFVQLGVVAASAWSSVAAQARRATAKSEKVCTCTCCGEHCPMGERCCCNAPKIPRQEPLGLFFAPLACHPGAADAGQLASLLFLDYRFLAPAVCALAPPAALLQTLSFTHLIPASIFSRPDFPPPRPLA